MATPTLDEIEAQIRTLCGAAPTQNGYARNDVESAGNIALALVAHVRAMNAGDSTRLVIVAEHTKRIAALEAKVAALSAADDVGRAAARAESATSPRMAQKAWAPVAEELDRLRAENAELRKRVEAGAWPAPQPIETAPLERTVFWYGIAFKEWRCFAVTAEDMDEVRAGYSHWIPMPPPPGGAK